MLTAPEIPKTADGGTALCHTCQRRVYFAGGYLQILLRQLKRETDIRVMAERWVERLSKLEIGGKLERQVSRYFSDDAFRLAAKLVSLRRNWHVNYRRKGEYVCVTRLPMPKGQS